MRQPPSRRNIAIVEYRNAGHTQKATAERFGVSAQTIKKAEERTRDYLDATAALKADPDNLVMLARAGRLDARAAYALRDQNIHRIEDLRGLTFVEMLKMPNMDRRGTEQIVRLAATLGIGIS